MPSPRLLLVLLGAAGLAASVFQPWGTVEVDVTEQVSDVPFLRALFENPDRERVTRTLEVVAFAGEDGEGLVETDLFGTSVANHWAAAAGALAAALALLSLGARRGGLALPALVVALYALVHLGRAYFSLVEAGTPLLGVQAGVIGAGLLVAALVMGLVGDEARAEA